MIIQIGPASVGWVLAGWGYAIARFWNRDFGAWRGVPASAVRSSGYARREPACCLCGEHFGGTWHHAAA